MLVQWIRTYVTLTQQLQLALKQITTNESQNTIEY